MDAGRACRHGAQRARAELWYERAIGLARRTQNVRAYVSAHLGLGAVLRDGGEHHDALRHIQRAGLTARRAGMRDKAAEAFHDALGISTLAGDLARATLYARRAAALYPRHHRRYPAFAYDASFLLVSRGMYAAALPILTAVVARLTSPAEQLVVRGTLARAAAGAGMRTRFEETAAEVERIAPTHPAVGAGALYSVAEGARLLDDWTTAARLAHRAAHLARTHDLPVALQRAEQLIRELEEREPGIPPLPRDDARGAILRKLAPLIRLRLRAWRGRTWRPRRSAEPPA